MFFGIKSVPQFSLKMEGKDGHSIPALSQNFAESLTAGPNRFLVLTSLIFNLLI